jgi:hypothetical protein
MSKVRYLRSDLRIACFLETIGACPTMENLTNRQRHRVLLELYSALPDQVRREARRRGRKIIQTVGIKSATANLFPARATAPRSTLSRKERADQMAALLRQSLGKCSSCSSWGHKKRNWPSEQIAEEFREFAGDMSLVSYLCSQGFYHLGHRRKQSINASEDTASIS